MGGCATKPKVVKGDDPAPEPTKEPEAKEEGDDEANKKQTISNLLDEKVTEIESDSKTPLEATKIESVEPVAQESTETKVPIEAEPLSIESTKEAATVNVGETQNKETSVAAAKDE